MASGTGLNPDQGRLLYLISKYSTASEKGEEELWIKELALMALIFRGIERGAFDEYDSAPNLVTFHGTKRYANVSQEGKNDLKHLREKAFVSKVKISTKYYDHISAFSITLEGVKALKTIKRKDRARVEAIITCHKCGCQLEVEMRKRVFESCTKCGLKNEIAFFDLESVPYRSRPYFPKEEL
jgi:hypothetical protein